MTFVDQTNTSSEAGNCVSACLASVLGLPLSLVPDFLALNGSEMWNAVRRWLKARGKSLVTFRSDALVAISEDTILLAGGRSPNNSGFHCVIGTVKGGTFHLLHDPAPSKRGLLGPPLHYLIIV